MHLSRMCPRQEHSLHRMPKQPTQSLGQSEQRWVSHGRRWSWGVGGVRADGAAATRTGEAQKLRLSRASDSWLMSRQYGSRCRMKSTLWS